jgi:hypothetical protein
MGKNDWVANQVKLLRVSVVDARINSEERKMDWND